MSERKLIFMWSDLHIGHENVLKFDNRPFTDLNHMHRVLVNNYNSTVPDNGICYFLGDVGLCKAEALRDFMKRLNNSTKVLILGNHDKGMNTMYKMGFDVVLNSASLWIAGHEVTMSHCPLAGVQREDTSNMKGAVEGSMWHGDHKNHRFTVPDRGQFHCHGHIHSPNGGKSEKILGKQYDVGVPANGYRPVSISVIESWISKYGR